MRKDSWLDATAIKVAHAVQNPNWGNQTLVDDAKIAIGVIIEALAAEAYTNALDHTSRWSDTDTDWYEVPDWLRSHLK